MSIGIRIKNLRDKNNLTQRELADKIHISYSVMNRIESGERPARDEEIRKIADVLGTTTDYLLGRTDEKNPYEPETIAAHKEGDEWTEEELEDIEKFKEYIRMRRQTEKGK